MPGENRCRRERNFWQRALGGLRDALPAMMFHMRLGRFGAVMGRMLKVSVSGVRVVRSLLMVAGFMVAGSFAVVKSCLLVMLGCLVMMFGGLL